jgi:hypothetical protein
MSFVTTPPAMLAFAAGDLQSFGSAVVAGSVVMARPRPAGYPPGRGTPAKPGVSGTRRVPAAGPRIHAGHRLPADQRTCAGCRVTGRRPIRFVRVTATVVFG